MRIFNSIREFIEYIPNCLVCGKPMNLAIHGIRSIKSDWSYTRTHIKMGLDENDIVSKNKDYALVVSVGDNKLVSGEQLIKSMSSRPIGLDKSCRTCNFKIQSSHDSNSAYKTGIFPSVKLEREELHYTKTHGKSVDIVRYFWGGKPDTSVSIDNKRVKSFDLDLSKFKDFDHLNNRISTLVTFQ